MEKVLSKTAGDLIDLMKARGVNQDSCIGTMLTLKTEENYKLMLRWIKKNPKAGQYEILTYQDILCPVPAAASRSASISKTRVKKIAVF